MIDSWRLNGESPTKPLTFVSIDAALKGGQPQLTLELKVQLQSSSGHKPAFLAVDILDSADTVLMQAIPTLDLFIQPDVGRHKFMVAIDLPPLIPGQYAVSLWMGSHNTETLDYRQRCVSFEVVDSPTPGRTFPFSSAHGFVVPRSYLAVPIHAISMSVG